ncbi:MAG TPA: lytic transglycosylase domain-containing protein [Vicinamibacterales bacterium]|nr:lytic transglycosylase domain-containing protein [Vicinamibacterales bacterium]
MRFRAVLVAVALWIWPLAANAQIYSWRDANGTLVLSDRSIDAPTKVYGVERAPSYVTTKPVEITSDHDRYEPLIQEHARRQSLRPELVRAVIQVESGFNHRALSPKGAMGLMQLMPETARSLGVNNPWDAAQNIRGGTQYLRMLLDQHDGNEQLALAAYNAGPKAVARYGRIPPYRETTNYVKKVRAAAGDAPVSKRAIYKTIEIVDGRAIPRYSTERPKSGSFQVVTR